MYSRFSCHDGTLPDFSNNASLTPLFLYQDYVDGGTRDHIHELWWDSNGWHDNDVTAAIGVQTVWGGWLISYVFAAQGTQHVFFWAGEGQGIDGHIIELWRDSNGWHYNDPTAAASAPAAYPQPTGYMFDAQGTQHVIYQGAVVGLNSGDGHIHELNWDDCDGWKHNDLTAAAGAPLASVFDYPRGYGFVAQGTQHVFYVATDNHIIELYWVPE